MPACFIGKLCYQLLDGHVHFITGMELKIEAERRLYLGNVAGKILADLLNFQNRRVHVHDAQRTRRA